MTSPVAVGDVLEGKYRIERVIGAGGMGVVVAATHLELGQLVAMKFLLAQGMGTPEVAVRFMREARAVARIKSEHVARVLDVGRLSTGSPYIVMEYLEGRDLEGRLREGPLAIEEAVDYVIQACDAMAAAHRLGIVHRDLKPANLFLTRLLDGSSAIKVLDFGISKSMTDTNAGALTHAGALIGSPLYMSPEQMSASKDLDLRSDIWSLGAVLFELLAGRPPFLADTIPALIGEITLGRPASLGELRPEVPGLLVTAVERCLEKAPADRFNDVAELASALAPFASMRAQLSVERVYRIVGSVPPPAPLSTPPIQRSSSMPVPSLPLGLLSTGARSALSASHTAVTPGSLRASVPSPELGALAAATAPVGQGTAPGWTGTGATPRRKSSLVPALGAAVVVLAVGVAVAMLTRKPEPKLETELSRTAAAAATPSVSTAAAEKQAEVLVAPALPAPALPAASASASAAPTANAIASAAKLQKKSNAPASPAAPGSSATETKKSALSMKLK